MRKKNVTQLGLFDQSYIDMLTLLPPEKELQRLDEILTDMPELVNMIHRDLCNGSHKNSGRPGVPAENILRCGILKTMKRLPYRELASGINGNISYRWFTKFNLDKVPHYTALQKLIKSISPDTWELISEHIVDYAKRAKIEKGRELRSDTTVVQTDISWPIDAKLLKDAVRVLTRLMEKALEIVPDLTFSFSKRTRRANKRCYQIVMAKGPKASQIRKKHYKDLLKVANEVFKMGSICLKHLKESPHLEALAIFEELDHYLTLSAVVIEQCERRVLMDESVPSDEKIVSIFEEHTDIIKRGKSQSPTEFGHKILFVTGKSGIITQYKTFTGNPGDNTMVKEIIENHKKQFGKAPVKFAGDRRFFSTDNEKLASEAGIKKMSVCKPGYRSKERIQKEKNRWFKDLQKFRAGIEGTISALMRGCSLKRCLWKGWRAFQSYIGLGVITFNLRKLAAI